jgi:hypothetical protein
MKIPTSGDFRVTLLLCLILGGWLPASAQSLKDTPAQDVYEVPFLYDPVVGPFGIIVQVELNGRKPFLFLLDTGDNIPITLANWVVDELGLKTTGRIKPENSSPLNVVQLEEAFLIASSPQERLKLGTQQAVTKERGLLEQTDWIGLQQGQKLAGIIGAPIVASIGIEIDFASKVILFHLNSISDPMLQEASVIPIQLSSKRGDYRFWVNAELSEGIVSKLLVDTGCAEADCVVLHRAMTRNLNPKARSPFQYTALTGQGNFAVERWLLSQVRIDKVTEPNVITDVAIRSVIINKEYDGLLGLTFLSRFKVIIDYRNKQMILKRPPSDKNKTNIRGWTGIELNRNESGSYYISDILEGSPAMKVGLKKGDVIRQVDGYPLQKLTQISVDSLLRGFSHTIANLIVERNEELKVIQVPRISEFEARTWKAKG